MARRFSRPLVPHLFLALVSCAFLGSTRVKLTIDALVVHSSATSFIGRGDDGNLVQLRGIRFDCEGDFENEQQATVVSNIDKITPIMSTSSTRRNLFANTCFLAAVATTLELPASAAEPVRAKDTDSVLAIAKRKLRPKPPKILRRKLSQDFAVLLMRSSYNALDEMDCVAMDQFQRDFFLIRVAEYETYTKNLGAGMVTQGDLTDPFYFDFISFAQYKTINREVTQDPPYVFEEQQVPPEGSSEPSMNPNGTARFVPVIVQRDPTLTNKMLIPTFDKKVGSKILDKLEENFANTESKIPNIGYKPDSVALLSGIRQIVNLFLIGGYAFKGDVKTIAPESNGVLATYVLSLSAPATLWSGKVLQVEGDPLDNNFLLKTLAEYIRRSGYINIKSSIKYEGTGEEITITVQ